MNEIEKLIRPELRNLKPYSSARHESNQQDLILLDANENPFGELNRYPDPYHTQLKSALANLKGLATNQVFLGNGSDEVIDLCFRLFCTPKQDSVMVFTPTYGMYEVLAQINDVSVIREPLINNQLIDIKSAKASIEKYKPKLLFICSPNNPTGSSIPIRDIEALLDFYSGVLVIDEAYIDFSKEESALSQLSKRKNLIVCQTLSKAYGLAGIRLGIAYASPMIVQWLNKIKPPYNISTLNAQAAFNRLAKKQDIQNEINCIIHEKAHLENELKKLECITYVYPSQANFLLIETPKAEKLHAFLLSNNIRVRDRSSLIKNSLRISIGSPQENKQLLKTLKSYEKESIIYR